eukprot:TRINITY_DN3337_c0_g1_i5.p1 TRINITY_DN3337_c0_g1~~TRINITY_DN3337_c0_g1_i5.p1  ORF type:complete len:475 (+),score=36.79 TRINITY_DN3337_c0_g1_i5:119-1543(+)
MGWLDDFKKNELVSRLSQWFSEPLGFDKRSLSVFRFMLGLVIFGDLCNRARDLHSHYTDAGIYTRHDVLSHHTSNYFFVVHFINGSWYFIAGLFAFHMMSALMFAFGFYTKLNNFITWFLLVSLHAASPFIGHAGDVYARMLLWWSMWLPVSEYWSIDASLKAWSKKPGHTSNRSTHNHFSFASMGLLSHIILCYYISYYHKSGPEWKIDGTAVFYALNLDYFQMPFARFLLTLPSWFLKYSCFLTLFWELYGPFLFIFPIKNAYFRILGIVGFWGMHLLFGISLRLGLFFYICMSCFFCCIPTLFWEKFLPLLRNKERLGSKIYYSSNNTFSECIGFFLRHFLIEETSVLPLTDLEYHNNVRDDTHTVGSSSSLSLTPPSSRNIQEVTINIESESFKTSSSSSLSLSNTWLLVQAHDGNELKNIDGLIYSIGLSPLLRPWGWILRKLPTRIKNFISEWLNTFALITISDTGYR